jgi:hypothetical protein
MHKVVSLIVNESERRQILTEIFKRIARTLWDVACRDRKGWTSLKSIQIVFCIYTLALHKLTERYGIKIATYADWQLKDEWLVTRCQRNLRVYAYIFEPYNLQVGICWTRLTAFVAKSAGWNP